MNDDRRNRLQQIDRELHALEASPLYDYRQENGYSPVIGEGDPHAAIMFIGEAPGEQEAQSGRPFVGAAGRVLDALLEEVGLDREKVYITNVVKDRPPNNRDPRVGEVELYAPFLRRQLEIIRPEVIVTLGRFAMDFILKEFDLQEQGRKISDLHGQTLTAEASFGEITFIPMYHPAATFYSRERKGELEEDFKKLERFA